MGVYQHLSLDSTGAACTPDSPENAQTQCNRGVADDVENRLAEMPSSIALHQQANLLFRKFLWIILDELYWCLEQ